MIATSGMAETSPGPCSEGVPVPHGPSHIAAQQEKAMPTGPARIHSASTTTAATREAATNIAAIVTPTGAAGFPARASPSQTCVNLPVGIATLRAPCSSSTLLADGGRAAA